MSLYEDLKTALLEGEEDPVDDQNPFKGFGAVMIGKARSQAHLEFVELMDLIQVNVSGGNVKIESDPRGEPVALVVSKRGGDKRVFLRLRKKVGENRVEILGVSGVTEKHLVTISEKSLRALGDSVGWEIADHPEWTR